MKPPPFKYVRAIDLPDALRLLEGHGTDAKVLAGGQSLLPMMNFRLVRPTALVDINRVAALSGIHEDPGGLRIGALTRHCETAVSPMIRAAFPIITEAMTHVAHLTVRNRGSFGGSVAHADPAAELPMLAVLLDARMTAASLRGERSIRAADFFVSALTTSLEPGELLTALEFPFLPPGTSWGFEEFARRHGDYALAAVGVTLRIDAGRSRDVRIAAMGVGDTPLRLHVAEAVLEGETPSDATLTSAIAALRDAVTPNDDLNASAEFRRHLVGVMAQRAIAAAWQRSSPVS